MAISKKELEPKDIWEMFAETDRRFKDLEKNFKKTDKFLKELAADTNKQIKATNQSIHGLSDTWGEFVEGQISPSTKKMFLERGIVFDRVIRNFEVSLNGKEGMEIDIMGINGDYVVLIEAKSTLRIRDVDDYLDRIAKSKHFFPEYKDRKVVGAVAGMVIKRDVDKYAYRKGLFVITQKGDTVEIINDKKFKPKEW